MSFPGMGARFCRPIRWKIWTGGGSRKAWFFLPGFWRELLNDPYITSSSQLGLPQVSRVPANSIQIKTCKYDELSASVFPEIPVPDSAVIVRNFYSLWSTYAGFHQGQIVYGDIVNADIVMTDLRASAVVYGLVADPLLSQKTSAAFHFDKDFIAVDHAINAGAAQNKVDSNRLNANLTLALFECEEFPVYAMYDSSLVANAPISIAYMMALTARGNASPRNFGLTGVQSPLTTKFVEPAAGAPAAYYMDGRERFKLVTADKRVVLHATEEEPEGRGNPCPDEMDQDLFYRAVQDVSILNHARLRKLRDVAGDLTREFLERGDALLQRVKAAKDGKQHLAYLRNLYEFAGIAGQVLRAGEADDRRHAESGGGVHGAPAAVLLLRAETTFQFRENRARNGDKFALLFVITFLVFRLIHPASASPRRPRRFLLPSSWAPWGCSVDQHPAAGLKRNAAPFPQFSGRRHGG